MNHADKLCSTYRKLEGYREVIKKRHAKAGRAKKLTAMLKTGDNIEKGPLVQKYLDDAAKQLGKVEKSNNLKKIYNDLQHQYMIKRVELIVQQSLFATINKKKLFLSQIEYEDYARDQTKELDRIVLKDHMNRLDEVRQLAHTDHHMSSGIEYAKKNNFRIGKSQNLTKGAPVAIKEEGNQTLSAKKKQFLSK